MKRLLLLLAALVATPPLHAERIKDLGTFEGRCPSTLLDEKAAGSLGAVDALRPEQEALIEQFYAGTLPAGLRLADRR